MVNIIADLRDSMTTVSGNKSSERLGLIALQLNACKKYDRDKPSYNQKALQFLLTSATCCSAVS